METLTIILWLLFTVASAVWEARYFHRSINTLPYIPPDKNIHELFMFVRSVVLILISFFAALPFLGVFIIFCSYLLWKWAVENWMIKRGSNWRSAAYAFFGGAILFVYIFYGELYKPLTFMLGAMSVFMFFHDGTYYVARHYLSTRKFSWGKFITAGPVSSTSVMDQKGLTSPTIRLILLLVGLFIWVAYYDLPW